MKAGRVDADSADVMPRRLLGELFSEAVAAVRGEVLVRQKSSLDGDKWVCRWSGGVVEWDLPKNGRIVVVGAGKATASLAKDTGVLRNA